MTCRYSVAAQSRRDSNFTPASLRILVHAQSAGATYSSWAAHRRTHIRFVRLLPALHLSRFAAQAAIICRQSGTAACKTGGPVCQRHFYAATTTKLKRLGSALRLKAFDGQTGGYGGIQCPLSGGGPLARWAWMVLLASRILVVLYIVCPAMTKSGVTDTL